jgi:hypothetical protein
MNEKGPLLQPLSTYDFINTSDAFAELLETDHYSENINPYRLGPNLGKDFSSGPFPGTNPASQFDFFNKANTSQQTKHLQPESTSSLPTNLLAQYCSEKQREVPWNPVSATGVINAQGDRTANPIWFALPASLFRIFTDQFD